MSTHHRNSGRVALTAAFALFVSVCYAHAAPAPTPAPAPVAAPKPAASAPAAPAADNIKLPHEVRSCTAEDLEGLFKLKNVLEKPKNGPILNAFHNAPHQYLFFRKTQTYVEVDGSIEYRDPKSMDIELQKRFKQDKRQFVLTENGALYFYKGGKPIEMYNCGVVLKREFPYQAGALLLEWSGPNEMVVKLYEPLLRAPLVPPTPAQSPPPPPPPPPPGRPGVRR